MSHPAVHPVEAPPLSVENGDAPRVRMKDFQGMPGTPGGLALRLFQSVFALGALLIMGTTSDFPSVTAFRSFAAYPTWKFHGHRKLLHASMVVHLVNNLGGP